MGSTIIVFSAEQAADALWKYGEDALIDQALALTDAELRTLWAWAGDHWLVDHDLPLKSRLVLDKISAFACIKHFEGRVRPLAQERRRPTKNKPERLRNAQPFQGPIR